MSCMLMDFILMKAFPSLALHLNYIFLMMFRSDKLISAGLAWIYIFRIVLARGLSRVGSILNFHFHQMNIYILKSVVLNGNFN